MIEANDQLKANAVTIFKAIGAIGCEAVWEGILPTISAFYGILIQMFWQEHAPPHFHALYGEFEALIDIRTLEVIRGSFPRRALSLVMEWAAQHRNELMEDWKLCETKQSPYKIPPLE